METTDVKEFLSYEKESIHEGRAHIQKYAGNVWRSGRIPYKNNGPGNQKLCQIPADFMLFVH